MPEARLPPDHRPHGIFPADAELSPLNPYEGETSPDGVGWPALDVVRPWATLSDDERRLFARMAEVFAAFMSHTDHEIPTGKIILGASFVREGDGMPASGTVSLFIDDAKVGEGSIITQPGNFSLVGEGLNVGKDPASPITDDYPGASPHAFTGGTIAQVVIDVSGEHYVDLESEARMMMKRE